jgi:hypothetical protein
MSKIVLDTDKPIPCSLCKTLISPDEPKRILAKGRTFATFHQSCYTAVTLASTCSNSNASIPASTTA